jgi:ribosomal protein L28
MFADGGVMTTGWAKAHTTEKTKRKLKKNLILMAVNIWWQS